MLIAIYLACSSQAFALGVGSIKAKSFIGQPLSLEIPLFNVESPDHIVLEVLHPDGEPFDGLRPLLSRDGSGSSVQIRSEAVMNEPYVSFTLNLRETGRVYRKQFTVLLEPGSPNTAGEVSLKPEDRVVKDKSVRPAKSSKSKRPPIMGPYDWAKEGALPKKFGAVLDGQSLWRVARRISPAMKVSNNQMMWALYKANPQAFANKTIESLRAGSYLVVPEIVEVARVSDAQARRLLAGLSNATRASLSVDSNRVEAVPIADQLQEEGSGPVASSMFVARTSSRVDSEPSADNKLIELAYAPTKEIIDSLTQTAASINQQLGHKERQLDSLEAQVAELKQRMNPVLATASILPLDKPVRLQSELKADGPSINIMYFGWVIVLSGLMVLGFIMRTRFVALWTSFRVPSAGNQLKLESNASDDLTSESLLDDNDFEHDYDISHSISVSEVSYSEDMSELFSELETQLQTIEKDIPAAEVDFEQRFAQVLAEEDFEYATQLLETVYDDGARDQHYHFYHLQLLALQHKHDSFQHYYSQIENDIPSFSNVVQTGISKLAVQLAHH